MKIDAIEAMLDATTLMSGGMLFRPTNSSGFFEITAREVKAAFQEIKQKLPAVQAGADTFTAYEILAFRLIVNHCEVSTPVPQRAFLPGSVAVPENIALGTCTEEELVAWIRDELVTPLQRVWLATRDLRIKDLLNGRYDAEKFEEAVQDMFEDWDMKTGKKIFKK